jgi:hypothetical protein
MKTMSVMAEYTEHLKLFMNQCPYDKAHIKEIALTYPKHVNAFGMRLKQNCAGWSYFSTSDEHDEFLEFIDGNGFKVEHFMTDIYNIYPINEVRDGN